MSIQEFYFAFALGIVGSLHCVQMCGPVVLSYSLPLVSLSKGQQITAHLFYNLGRITTYSAMGVVAGIAGGAAGIVGKLAGFEHMVTIIVGVLMIAAGVLISGWVPLGRLSSVLAVKPAAALSRRVGNLLKSANVQSKFLSGIVLGFLPCGLVYAALLKAVESGGPVAGALTMACFGLGTVWSLLLLGVFSSTVSHWLRRWANQFAAIGIILIGGLLLWRGVMASMSHAHMHH